MSLSRWLLTKSVECVTKSDCFASVRNAQLKRWVETGHYIWNNPGCSERCLCLSKSVRISIGTSLSLLESGVWDGDSRG